MWVVGGSWRYKVVGYWWRDREPWTSGLTRSCVRSRRRSLPGDARAGSIFFFQAEDGIRDVAVTGVQTCALPIWLLAAAMITTSDAAAVSAPGRSQKPGLASPRRVPA